MQKRLLIIFCGIILVFASCNGNLFSVMENKSSYGDQAFWEQMQIDVNNSAWDTALADYASLTTQFQNQRTVQNLYAGALAGKCGFTFIGFFQSLSSFSYGSTAAKTPFFLSLMQTFKSTTVTMAVTGGVTAANASATTDTYCSWAQQIMDTIKTTYGSWTTDEQIFVATFSLAKIGMILKFWLDPTGTGVPSTTADVCTNGSTGIPTFYMNQIVTGFALFLSNISAIAGVSTSLSSLTGLCTAYPNICSDTTPSTVATADEKFMRDLITLEDNPTYSTVAGYGVYSFTSSVAVNTADPGSNAWQCNPANLAGVAACCP